MEDQLMEMEDGGGEGEQNAVVASNNTTNEYDVEGYKAETGGHYMVFIFQSWTSKHKHIHFTAARYALSTVNSRWLRRAGKNVIAMLASFNMIVTGISYDGASENRCWMKHVLTIQLQEALGDLFDDGNASLIEDGGNEGMFTHQGNSRFVYLTLYLL